MNSFSGSDIQPLLFTSHLHPTGLIRLNFHNCLVQGRVMDSLCKQQLVVPGEVLSNGLMEMCHWMRSHFHH